MTTPITPGQARKQFDDMLIASIALARRCEMLEAESDALTQENSTYFQRMNQALALRDEWKERLEFSFKERDSLKADAEKWRDHEKCLKARYGVFITQLSEGKP